MAGAKKWWGSHCAGATANGSANWSIYRVVGQIIYDQYKEAKRAVDRKIKAREQELMKQIQKEYDTIAPVRYLVLTRRSKS